MNKEQDDKIQEILNQKGQGIADRAMQEMTSKNNRNIIESSKEKDKSTDQLRDEAETTRSAYNMLQDLKGNTNVKNSISKISEEIKEVYIKQHFNCSSPHQPAVDEYVKNELDKLEKQKLAKVVTQLATNIMEETMENITQENVKGDEER